ncbi:SubName: Full=Uncharacterized protein {ECO:0000313/EMBL:CCA72352.1} [Serendipita indica DSM 11827]|nr:SubName: Full=Uncharacterized protein {ECO:0000313/EMBL:CCA72352.1} [Serendipita indica DSM 11827]
MSLKSFQASSLSLLGSKRCSPGSQVPSRSRDWVRADYSTVGCGHWTGFGKATSRVHSGSVRAVGFLPDGSRIVSGSSDKTIRLWDVETGQALGKPFRGHESSVLAVRFLSDGSRIVSGSRDKTIRLWDADTGLSLGQPLRGHEGSVRALGISPDGSQIASGSSDKTIRLWDADTGAFESHFRNRLWLVRQDYRIWDADTGRTLREPFCDHEFPVLAVGFSPDGSRSRLDSSIKTIRLWDNQWNIVSIIFSPDGSRIVSESRDKTIDWDVDNGSKIVSSSQDQTVSTMGCRIWTTSGLWDIITRTSLGAPFPVDEYSVLAVVLARWLEICGSSDRIIQLWDADTGQALGKPLRVHSGSVRAVGFSPDGSKIVSGSSGRRIQLWDVNTGNPLGEPVWRHNGSVLAVGFSPDGSRIVSGSADKTIQLWEADTGQPIGEPLRVRRSGVRRWVLQMVQNLSLARLIKQSDCGM